MQEVELKAFAGFLGQESGLSVSRTIGRVERQPLLRICISGISQVLEPLGGERGRDQSHFLPGPPLWSFSWSRVMGEEASITRPSPGITTFNQPITALTMFSAGITMLLPSPSLTSQLRDNDSHHQMSDRQALAAWGRSLDGSSWAWGPERGRAGRKASVGGVAPGSGRVPRVTTCRGVAWAGRRGVRRRVGVS